MPAPSDDPILEHLLVLRAQVGDEQAFTRLFDRHGDRMLYYLRRLVGPADAEDALQEVWLVIHRKLGGLADASAFRPWIYQVARRLALARSRKQRRALEVEAAAEVIAAPGEALDVGDALAALDVAAVHAALLRLPALHREALTLRLLEELSYDEIAAVVGCSPGTVRSRIHYGRKALQELLRAPRLITSRKDRQ